MLHTARRSVFLDRRATQGRNTDMKRLLTTLAAALVITATATLSSAQTIGFKERTSNDFNGDYNLK